MNIYKCPHCGFDAKLKNCVKWHMNEDHGETLINVLIACKKQTCEFACSGTVINLLNVSMKQMPKFI